MTVGNMHAARYGAPSLGIAEDEMDMIVALLVLGARRARPILLGLQHFDENGASLEVFKAIVAVQRRFRIQVVEFHPEGILLGDGRLAPAKYKGRIDFQVKTRKQHGDYSAYVGVECKLLRGGQPSKTRYYARAGVGKYADSTYSPGHAVAMLVGYVLANLSRAAAGDPLQDAIAKVEASVMKHHQNASSFKRWRTTFRDALIMQNEVPRTGSSPITLLHAMLRMYA